MKYSENSLTLLKLLRLYIQAGSRYGGYRRQSWNFSLTHTEYDESFKV
jgi:hypothetical protein